MANFTPISLSYLDHHNDFSWDLLNPFTPINNPMDYQSLMGFSNDNLPAQETSLVQEKVQEINDNICGSSNKNVECGGSIGTKRKGEELVESTSLNSSSHFSNEGTSQKNNSGRGKRTKAKEKTEEKPKEVVHVRARRGQATDSHSIAERIRRGKINERLKCLQEIVPGCNKQTMGMAVMLDEIINYVQSLQNQVEFLSMKLTAASQFHDFNIVIEPHEKTQNTNGSNCNGADEEIIENTIKRRGYDQDFTNFFQQTWPF